MKKLPISDIKEIIALIDEVSEELGKGSLANTAPVVIRVWKGVKSDNFSLIQDLQHLYNTYKNIPNAELEIGEPLEIRINKFTTEIHQFIELLKNVE